MFKAQGPFLNLPHYYFFFIQSSGLLGLICELLVWLPSVVKGKNCHGKNFEAPNKDPRLFNRAGKKILTLIPRRKTQWAAYDAP